MLRSAPLSLKKALELLKKDSQAYLMPCAYSVKLSVIYPTEITIPD